VNMQVSGLSTPALFLAFSYQYLSVALRWFHLVCLYRPILCRVSSPCLENNSSLVPLRLQSPNPLQYLNTLSFHDVPSISIYSRPSNRQYKN
jgi:hypothetical protein